MEHVWYWVLGGAGVWLAWLTVAVLYLSRQSPRELALEVADLTDRFTHWQKREMVRIKRAEGTALQEAAALLSAQPIPRAPAAPVVPPEGTKEFKSWLRRKAGVTLPE